MEASPRIRDSRRGIPTDPRQGRQVEATDGRRGTEQRGLFHVREVGCVREGRVSPVFMGMALARVAFRGGCFHGGAPRPNTARREPRRPLSAASGTAPIPVWRGGPRRSAAPNEDRRLRELPPRALGLGAARPARVPPPRVDTPAIETCPSPPRTPKHRRHRARKACARPPFERAGSAPPALARFPPRFASRR